MYMCIVFIDWSDKFQKVSVPQTVMIRLPALLPDTEPIKEIPCPVEEMDKLWACP